MRLWELLRERAHHPPPRRAGPRPAAVATPVAVSELGLPWQSAVDGWLEQDTHFLAVLETGSRRSG